MESSVINPIFHENNSVSVVFSFDEEFCKYFSVTLQSIIDNANHYTNYDLVVLTSYISENSLQRLSSQLPENFSLRVINIKTFLDAHFPNITLEKVGRWPIEMYFRIFIPLIMRSYKKILYLDSDLITETDILTLFNQEFENKKSIAVPDTLPHLKYEKGVEHLINDLKLKNIRNYFNSRVLLFNIQAIEPLNHLQNMKKTFKTTKLIFPDQDILNVIFEDEVKLISNKWNYSCGVFTYAKYFLNQIEDEEYKNDFLEAKTNPKIIHFSSKLKPWNYRLIEYFDRFWYYARKTPFYTKLLCDIKTLNISSLQEETALI